MADANPAIEKLANARTRWTCTMSDAERGALEQGVLENIAKKSHVKGFRAGHAPLGIIKEQTKPETLTEEVVHVYLREYLPKFLKKTHLTPIIPPKVELLSPAPLTLRITIVEKPTVKFKKKDALRIPKKDIDVTDAEITKALESLRKDHAIPEWTDVAVQKQWGIPSLGHLRTSITSALQRQKATAERKQREEAFFEQVQTIVEIDLAPELLVDEERQMLHSLQARLQSENISFADWLKRTGRSEEAFHADLRNQAGRRLRIRFGIDALLAEHQITVSDEELSKEIEEFLRSLPPAERDRLTPLYAHGGEGRERFHWQRRLQKLLAVFLE